MAPERAFGVSEGKRKSMATLFLPDSEKHGGTAQFLLYSNILAFVLTAAALSSAGLEGTYGGIGMPKYTVHSRISKIPVSSMELSCCQVKHCFHVSLSKNSRGCVVLGQVLRTPTIGRLQS